MVFDECPPGDAGFDKTKKSLEMTARWAKRSKDRFNELQNAGMDTGFLSQVPGPKSQDLGESSNGLEARDLGLGTQLNGQQALFGIVQGAGHLELRKQSLELTTEIGFDGYAIGGLSVGEEKAVMYEVLEFLAPQMPSGAPRYLMGVGTPEDLIEAVHRGVD